MASMRENMENRAASSMEDPNTFTCHVSTVLKSLCQMLKRMNYHIYQPHLVPNYTFLLLIHPLFHTCKFNFLKIFSTLLAFAIFSNFEKIFLKSTQNFNKLYWNWINFIIIYGKFSQNFFQIFLKLYSKFILNFLRISFRIYLK